MSRRTWLRSAVAAATLAACGGSDRNAPAAQPAPSGRRALTGGQVFTGGAFSQASVGFDGDRITAVTADVPGGVAAVDCTDLWLLPGFIDAHVHLQFADPASVLAGGVTTVRDLGSPHAVGLALRNPTPLRVLAAGQILTPVGGYPSQSWGADGTSRQVRSAEDAPPAVAEQADAGAAVIKVALEPNAGPLFDAATLDAIVTAAHARNLQVTAHVGAAEALRLAMESGVDELAHLPLHAVTPAEMVAAAGAGMVVVSTLQINAAPTALEALAAFRGAGGVVVFGSASATRERRPASRCPRCKPCRMPGCRPPR
jgi:imidazolonepropionase-like amidohydrolase